jgi:hypothetical protein
VRRFIETALMAVPKKKVDQDVKLLI